MSFGKEVFKLKGVFIHLELELSLHHRSWELESISQTQSLESYTQQLHKNNNQNSDRCNMFIESVTSIKPINTTHNHAH